MENTKMTRAEKTRANQLARKNHVEGLIKAANDGNTQARAELIMILSKAVKYHDSGKIEGLFSLDTDCSNNDFCPMMQASENPACICNYCYTKNMWDAAKFAHHIIGMIISQVDFSREELSFLAVPADKLRINSDGELINHVHAVNIIRIAYTHPMTRVVDWTKRPVIMDAAIKQEGKPENLICGISSPIVNRPLSPSFPWVDFVFTVYTPAGMRAALARGEHECNGRKCMECGFHCYAHHAGGPVFVAEALRCPKGIKKADFPAVIAAIDKITLPRE